MTKRTRLSIELLLFIPFIVVCVIFHSDLKTNPLNTVFTLSLPFKSQMAGRDLYTVDDSLKRFSCIDSTTKTVKWYKKFNSIQDFTIQDQYIYIVNNIVNEDTQYSETEEILKYNLNGEPIKTIFKINHTNKDVNLFQRASISCISKKDKNICWSVLYSSNIILYTYNGSSIISKSFQYKNANECIYFAKKYDENSLAISTKFGTVEILYENGIRNVLYTAAKQNTISTPYYLVVMNNNIFFSDLSKRTFNLISDGNVKEILNIESLSNDIEVIPATLPVRFHIPYYSSPSNFSIVLCNGYEFINFIDVINSKATCTTIKEAKVTEYKAWFVWIMYLLLVGFYCHILFTKRDIVRWPLAIVAATFILLSFSALIITSMLTVNKLKNYEHNIYESHFNIYTNTIKKLDYKLVQKYVDYDDYYTKDYLTLRSNINYLFCKYSNDVTEKSYYALYNVSSGVVYAMMYRNNDIGPFYRLPYFEEGDCGYNDAFTNNTLISYYDYDVSGDWFYLVGSISNNHNEAIGLLEYGQNMILLRNKFSNESYFNLISIILLIVFVFSLYNVVYYIISNEKKKAIIMYLVLSPIILLAWFYNFLVIEVIVVYIVCGAIGLLKQRID